MKEALKVKIDDPEERLIELNDRHQLGETQRLAVDWAFPQEMGPTLFHLIQTFTKAAQHGSLSVHERYSLQVMASSILHTANS